MASARVYLSVPERCDVRRLMGPADRVSRLVEELSSSHIGLRGERICIQGEPQDVECASRLFSTLIDESKSGRYLGTDDIKRLYGMIAGRNVDAASVMSNVILSHKGHQIRPKTAGQKLYVDAIRSHTITFGIGPAGTGKTFLSMALAVSALERHDTSRIVLTRPVVEAGESLGFLPGTLEEKIDPYLRPLFDALHDMLDGERIQSLMDAGFIEIAPLAYMRGRTINDAFVILDEAQNTTAEQMKMFLTRLGFNSRFVITGDITQRDLMGRVDGLSGIEPILRDIDDIAFVHLDKSDVVRHELVGRIVEAYDAYEQAHERGAHDRRHQKR